MEACHFTFVAPKPLGLQLEERLHRPGQADYAKSQACRVAVTAVDPSGQARDPSLSPVHQGHQPSHQTDKRDKALAAGASVHEGVLSLAPSVPSRPLSSARSCCRARHKKASRDTVRPRVSCFRLLAWPQAALAMPTLREGMTLQSVNGPCCFPRP